MKSLILFLFSFMSFQVLSQSYGLDAIYGLDDRIDIHDENDPKIKLMKDSIALIVSSDLLKKGLTSSILSGNTLESNAKLCKEERFIENKSMSGCTGFLISEDLLVSAGHCFMAASDCSDQLIIFGIGTSQQTKTGYTVSNRDIYQCSEIIDAKFGGVSDYAIIRLSKKTKRPTLKIRKLGMVKSDDEVFMLGHPMGTPLKKSSKVKINDNEHLTFFKAPLDSFTGNSGSPVINARTLLVEGILVNGQEDFLLDNSKQCYRNRVYDEGNESSTHGEGVTRISEILNSGAF